MIKLYLPYALLSPLFSIFILLHYSLSNFLQPKKKSFEAQFSSHFITHECIHMFQIDLFNP